MSTLVVRLAGPLQAWGAEPRLRTVTTHRTPTLSGLLGLSRAALGHGRHANPADVAWLRDLTFAVRVDQPGTSRTDFHTVNPLPDTYARFGLSTIERGIVPAGTTLQAKGQAPRWAIGGKVEPLVTKRSYLHDAAFTWLTTGPEDLINRLATAFTNPVWTLSLGKKNCPPASPFLLGTSPGNLTDTARAVPRLVPTRQSQNTRPVDLVWLNGTPDSTLPTTSPNRVIRDLPLGSHPLDGHTANTHAVTASPNHPTVTTLNDLLTWATAHLTHPAWTPETP